ncbi:MAG: TetR/AcrR family transcriptional regulator [Thermoclostridium sp.]|nr:TetR/AcrR family transcriptional regulator [Thermoclostridium sp.]
MTKTKILDRALELFTLKGYFSCSMDDIAKAVDIKKPSLYFHYPSKESIFQAIFQSILDNYTVFIEGITDMNDEQNSLVKLSEIFTKYVKNCVNSLEMQFWDRYYYYPPDFFKDEFQNKTYQVEMDLMNKLVQIVQKGIQKNEIKPLDAQSIAACFYNMMIGLAMGVKFYDEEKIDEEITRCLDVFISGIQA